MVKASRRVAAVAIASGLVLAGCGQGAGQGQKGNPVAIVTASYGKTVSASTARISMDMSFQLKGNPFTTQASGEADFASRAADMSMVVTVAGRTVQVQGRILGGTMYLKLPGQPWHSQPVPSAATSVGSPADPSQILSWLRGVTGAVSRVGTETIRGVPTTQYAATVDLSRVGATSAAAEAQANQFESQMGTTLMPMQVWVDGQGLTRQVQLNMTPRAGSPMADQGLSGMRITIDLYDFGVPVHVSVPT